MRPPDKEGPFARAWKRALPDPPARPDWAACLECWYVHAPKAHPFWAWWIVSTIHLRPIPEVPPANLRYPEAEHELMIIALNPDHDPPPGPDVDDVRHLVPIDFVGQFHGMGDAGAAAICSRAVAMIVNGRLSPDQDYRRAWRQWLAAQTGGNAERGEE